MAGAPSGSAGGASGSGSRGRELRPHAGPKAYFRKREEVHGEAGPVGPVGHGLCCAIPFLRSVRERRVRRRSLAERLRGGQRDCDPSRVPRGTGALCSWRRDSHDDLIKPAGRRSLRRGESRGLRLYLREGGFVRLWFRGKLAPVPGKPAEDGHPEAGGEPVGCRMSCHTA